MEPVTLALPAEQRRRELARDIAHAALLRGDFTLGSGVGSDFLLDSALFLTRPAILRRIASFLGEMVPADADRLAGAGTDGTALAAVVSLEIGIPFVMTGEAMDGDSAISGELHPGDRVVLLVDILEAGSSALTLMDALVRRGAEVLLAQAVVDLQKGAGERLEAAGCSVQSLFSGSDLGLEPDSEQGA